MPIAESKQGLPDGWIFLSIGQGDQDTEGKVDLSRRCICASPTLILRKHCLLVLVLERCRWLQQTCIIPPHPAAGIVLTNDGNAILREIDVSHPAAKVTALWPPLPHLMCAISAAIIIGERDTDPTTRMRVDAGWGIHCCTGRRYAIGPSNWYVAVLAAPTIATWDAELRPVMGLASQSSGGR